METQIIPLKLRITNCYLLKGSEGFIMVDAGPPKSSGIFLKAMKKLSIDPGDIKMIFITHGHWDHWGSLPEIRGLTRAQTAINHREKVWVEEPQNHIPGGIGAWGKIVSLMLQSIKPIITKNLHPTQIEISLDDDEFSLAPFGIQGRLLHTPGHTDGSMSLILDSGEAFVGDLAMSGFPRISGPGPFVVGKDVETMKQSWKILLDAGAARIYPSHGKPFNATVFDEYL